MHTYTTATIVIHHNGDYKGECTIVDIESGTEIVTTCEDIMGFAAQAIRENIISRIENLSDKDILSGKREIL